MDLRERIEAKIAPPDENGCRRWLGRVSKYGTPEITRDCRPASARRELWEIERGPVSPDHIVVPSVCNNQLCMCLAHATLTTIGRDALYRRPSITAANALKVVCVHGHPLSGTNLRTLPDGKRKCMTCERRLTRDWQQANPEKHRAHQDKWNKRRREQYRSAAS